MSAHFYIRRNGELWQFVSCDERAWHAGASHYRGRDNCNDDSIGIELEGLEGEPFEPAQYEALAGAVRRHRAALPGRSTSPGTSTSRPAASATPARASTGRLLQRSLAWPAQCFPAISRWARNASASAAAAHALRSSCGTSLNTYPQWLCTGRRDNHYI